MHAGQLCHCLVPPIEEPSQKGHERGAWQGTQFHPQNETLDIGWSMECTTTSKHPDCLPWVWEIKLDGYVVIARR
jgi:hypothetical protein